MACWCDDDDKDGQIVRANLEFEIPPRAGLNFCPTCGRDLRLPVARVYEPGCQPECTIEMQWWKVKKEDGDCWTICELTTGATGGYVFWAGSAQEGNLFAYDDSPYWFVGPVTVSPREVTE